MSKIKQLNEHLKNIIAAGEVVERPMGVVKELVENSIDAQSSKIEINLTNGGLDAIEIIDDGCGMDKQDICLAFNRHATSKIEKDDDIFNIHTMGFRGEALPSIASVSKVTMDSSDGIDQTRIRIEYGQIKEVKPYGCDKGTTIKVEGLFYKTPARLKHLKSANTESNVIIDLISKMALANPDIAFTLTDNNKVKLQTNGSGQLLEAIMTIYGLDVAKRAIEINSEDYDFKIKGYAILPAITRSNKNYINTFINSRLIKSYSLTNAVIEAYKSYIMSDRYPIVVINIETDYQLVDVNVHPSKWEVRISKEKQLAQLITKSINEEIRKSMKPSDVLLDNPKKDEIIYEEKVEDKKEVKQKYLQEQLIDYDSNQLIERFKYLAQLHGKYILACDEDNLYIIDQHAAQERCMYEEIQKQIEKKDINSQMLLVPLVIDVNPAIVNQIDLINERLSCINLTFEAFSSSSLLVREVPDFFDNIDEVDFLNNLVNEVVNNQKLSVLDIRKEKIASLACHSSVRFNHYLSVEESKKLLSRLSNCQQPFNCPHGRPTMISISEKQLIKEFKRA